MYPVYNEDVIESHVETVLEILLYFVVFLAYLAQFLFGFHFKTLHFFVFFT